VSLLNYLHQTSVNYKKVCFGAAALKLACRAQLNGRWCPVWRIAECRLEPAQGEKGLMARGAAIMLILTPHLHSVLIHLHILSGCEHDVVN
jgi:hypothetical protein